MGKPDSDSSKREHNTIVRWVVAVFVTTLFVSGIISFLSEALLETSGLILAFFILLAIVLVGILFDIVGVAVTSADERPFHSMASRKVVGAQEAIRLLRNAGRVSSICCDVVGDICGVISGSASATITAQILSGTGFTWSKLLSLTMSAIVAGLTVGGKAVGKAYAIESCTKIVHSVGVAIHTWNQFLTVFRKK